VILVCVGRATRLVEYLVGQTKRYVAEVRLGQETDTYDADGAVVDEKPVAVSREEIEQMLGQFRGRIQQRAPAYSAIKRDGQPLYKLARQGKDVDPPVRTVEIVELYLQTWQNPYLQLELSCSSGTYVRSLAHDLGQLLGCGGHITRLERTAVGAYKLDQAVSLEALHNEPWTNHLLPTDSAVQHMPLLELSAEETARVQVGKQIKRAADHPQAALVRIYEPDGRFLGIVKQKDENWQPHKLFLASQ
jgi:tRNA pseudouridine55 synthase